MFCYPNIHCSGVNVVILMSIALGLMLYYPNIHCGGVNCSNVSCPSSNVLWTLLLSLKYRLLHQTIMFCTAPYTLQSEVDQVLYTVGFVAAVS